ncbi:MAG: electron transport complex subunit RsxC [Ruminococcaceae bacterium]|nr:electron transport complex subunit RsxC [Oscillospiraceae bacterium]
MYTFKGGSHVKEYKNTRHAPIEHMPAPAIVSIPLSQHIGVPCRAVVKAGDHVDYAQLIGDIESGLGCPVHSSVSGTVKRIETVQNAATGQFIESVVIENDGLYTRSADAVPYPKALEDTTPEEIVAVVRKAGISGMGGATFPTYAKIQSAIGKADTLIINCAECEPFITANHRMMLERPEEIMGGVKILMHVLGLSKAYVGIEDNKMDAVETMRAHAGEGVEIFVVKTKYPQGDERQLIYALTKKELPAGKLPADLGCVIFNAETTATIWHAFYKGSPLCQRVVTVDGDCVARPANVRVPIGTSYKDLIAYCGGLLKKPEKIVNGGPMMGFAQWDFNAPLTKGSSAILVLSREFCQKGKSKLAPACIRCGRCVHNCPMHLTPNMLVGFAMARRFKDAEAYNAMSCVECGTCSYNCPGGMEIVQHIRVAKAAIRAEQMAARARQMEQEKKGEK